MVVPGQGENAAQCRGSSKISVLQHIAGAVDPRALAVPQAKDAVLAVTVEQGDVLGAPDRCGSEVLVDAALDDDIMGL